VLLFSLTTAKTRTRKLAETTRRETPRSAALFGSFDGPFKVNIPVFSSNITRGYSNASEAEHDFEELAKFLLNGIITSNAQENWSGQPGPLGIMDDMVPTAAGTITQDSPAADDSAKKDPGSSVGDATDFETTTSKKKMWIGLI
jgi:hypothetical protein